MQRVIEQLKTFEPVTLKQLDSVKLQNRIDTKYIMSKAQLVELLKGIKEDQYVLEIEGNYLSQQHYQPSPESTRPLNPMLLFVVP